MSGVSGLNRQKQTAGIPLANLCVVDKIYSQVLQQAMLLCLLGKRLSFRRRRTGLADIPFSIRICLYRMSAVCTLEYIF